MSNIGKIAWNKGIPMKYEIKQKIIETKRLNKSHEKRVLTEDHKKNISKMRTKNTYKIIYPDKTEEIVFGLEKFCIKHNLNSHNLRSVAAGKRNHSLGYKCERIL